MKVPLLDLQAQYATIRDEVRAAIDRVCDSQHFILGPEVAALEDEVAAHCDARFAVGVSSGTDALVLALRALKVGPDDEVITVPNTYVATVFAITYVGATPVFVDIDPTTANMDPARVAAAVLVALLILLLLLPAGAAASATLVAALAGAAILLLAYRRLGGVTGDVLGALQQGAEIAFLLSLVAAAAR